MIGKEINIIDYEEESKFECEFKKYKKVVIVYDGELNYVRNYKEFLEQFSFNSGNSINELEEFFISFIKCIAIMKDIEIIAVYESDKIIGEYHSRSVKKIYMNNFQSIIDVVVNFNIANILVVY